MLRSEAAVGGVIRLSTVTGNHDEPCSISAKSRVISVGAACCTPIAGALLVCQTKGILETQGLAAIASMRLSRMHGLASALTSGCLLPPCRPAGRFPYPLRGASFPAYADRSRVPHGVDSGRCARSSRLPYPASPWPGIGVHRGSVRHITGARA